MPDVAYAPLNSNGTLSFPFKKAEVQGAVQKQQRAYEQAMGNIDRKIEAAKKALAAKVQRNAERMANGDGPQESCDEDRSALWSLGYDRRDAERGIAALKVLGNLLGREDAPQTYYLTPRDAEALQLA